jgi:hypothetical protein
VIPFSFLKTLPKTSLHNTPELRTHPRRVSRVQAATQHRNGVAAFLRAHMSSNVKDLTSVERNDGLGLLRRLQTMYASWQPTG